MNNPQNNETTETVAELAARLTGNPSMADAVRAESTKSELCETLARIRIQNGLTQRALAKRMGVSASKVCRIESGSDDDLSLGDLRQYIMALGCGITLAINQRTRSAAERIKEHIVSVHHLLDELAELAKTVGAGDQIARGIQKFYGEVLFNFLLKFGESAEKLPRFSLESQGSCFATVSSTSMKRPTLESVPNQSIGSFA